MTVTTPVDNLLAKLPTARQTGSNQWEACCPAHDDRSPSLGVSVGEKGQAILNCLAGCDWMEIIAVLGMEARDLWPTSANNDTNGHRRRSELIAQYPYVDETGELLYEVFKWVPGFDDESKTFRPKVPGEKKYGYHGVRRVLYRLPEVIAAIAAGRTVWITEGEKDADALVAAGEVATCNPGGAKAWHLVPDAPTVLTGAEVIIWVDDDKAGHDHGRKVVASIDGKAASWHVAVSRYGNDAAEHLGQKRDLEDDLDLLASCDGDWSWLDGDAAETVDDPEPPPSSILEKYQASEIDWSEFWDRDLTVSDWLVEPILPRGRGIATYSPPKAGKSVLSLDVVAKLATGRRCLDHPARDPMHVLYIDAEMTQDDVYERLGDMGYGPDVDMSHLHYQLLPDLPPLDTPAGGKDLVALAEAYGAELVVIDTVAATVEGAENESDTFRNYWAFTGRPLKAAGCTVWRLDHSGKDPAKGQRGSSQKAGDVDVVWELTLRENDAVRLRATHRRVSWVPEQVDLVRLEEPLRHERASGSWPAGTKEMAELLDELDVAVDASRRDARAAIKEANRIGGRNEVLQAALRWRRESQQEPFG